MRQGVEVESGLWNLFGERWTYTAKRRVFGRALKEICDISCYREADDESKYKYIEEIFEKVKLCEALYIQIPAGISRCIELIVIDNLRFPDFIHRKDQDVLTASLELAAEEERELRRNYKGVSIYYRDFRKWHYFIQSNERYCKSCERVTCKCLVEECDVV